MPMNTEQLKAILQAEKASALGSSTSTDLTKERSDAMDYYLGDMRDMAPPKDRSKAVSTDVADTVEGLMPSLIEVFCSGDEVVRFEPVGPEDEEAAEQETDYVNHVFMQQNEGFMLLYSGIKDALLQKNGVWKVWWEAGETAERETFYDLPDDVYALIASDPEVEVVEHTERGGSVADAAMGGTALTPLPPAKTHDVTVMRRKPYGCAKVACVPPEEFGISRRAKTIKDSPYCYHKVRRSVSELIEAGYDRELVESLPSAGDADTEEALSRRNGEEDSYAGDINRSMREVEVTEHYVRLDYDGDGIAELRKITTAGASETVLTKGGQPDNEPVEAMPFASITPVPVTHRFFGRSVADLVMEIQRIKTFLLRQLLDNAALANNQRMEVSESHAGDKTLDDLLTSRPGGVIRTRAPGGLMPIPSTPIGNNVLPLIEYVDQVREQRTGVTRQGQGLDANALQNQSATAVNQAFTAAQARIKLIARIFAETGIKDLFWLLHHVIRSHDTAERTVKLRNKWVPVSPRQWKTRTDLTVTVGIGHGTKEQQTASLMGLLGIQKEALAAGGMGLVDASNLYNTLKKLVELNGLKSVDPYFTDPKQSQQQEQPKPDPKMMEAQAKLQLEQQKAQADMDLARAKMQQEFTLKQQQMEAEMQLARERMAAEIQLQRETAMLRVQAGAAIQPVRMGGEVG